ncbi:hypothetical protein NDU88_001548 [Pleurodeles waltl]|uniref:Uncharacterized protein n=1 Tax=Pleurodeles waltl TaxID=8319 RepID=A0AAV7P4A3_PLEWA|nr:hypothetical protein NDU88_001548 [Pleurodeles waltl]
MTRDRHSSLRSSLKAQLVHQSTSSLKSKAGRRLHAPARLARYDNHQGCQPRTRGGQFNQIKELERCQDFEQIVLGKLRCGKSHDAVLLQEARAINEMFVMVLTATQFLFSLQLQRTHKVA